jgi:Flavin containing amine oxidoreductase
MARRWLFGLTNGWVEARGATTVTAALQADWDAAEARAAIPESDRFVDGVEWFLADPGLEGDLAELARFALLWMAGALVIAGPPDRISLAGAAAYAEGSGGNLVPAGGYGALVDLLADGLEVRLGTTVTRIDHGGADLSVVTDRGTFDADHAIVTVPLGVLRAGAVTFDPQLDRAHASAVEHLEMGTEEKVVFRFSERFWPESVWEITHVAEDRAFPAWFDFSRHVTDIDHLCHEAIAAVDPRDGSTVGVGRYAHDADRTGSQA